MNYPDGQQVMMGDIVSLGGESGVVACSIDTCTYSDVCREEEWAYLGEGSIIMFEAWGLIHYVQPDPDLKLLSRREAVQG